MKYRLVILLCVLALALSGCAPEIERVEKTEQIYASFYPVYALGSMLLEDVPGVRLKCLVQPQDDCLRLYDLSDWDASVLAYDADAVLIVGSGLESFESALYTFGDGGPAIITASYGLSLFNDDGEADIDGDVGHLSGANPHLYMSITGARGMLSVIAEALEELYPDKAELIAANALRADDELASLREETKAICSDAQGGQVILMNEALIYPALEYGLTVAYRYDRESGTTLYGTGLDEAISAFDATGARVILIEKQAPVELVRALEDAGYTVALIDVMSAYSNSDGADAYIERQRANAQAIADAFSAAEG